MKKSTIITLAVVAVLVIWAVSSYNGLVKKQENVENKWSQVENTYQRRADLIPNLVNTVKGYAAHEQGTFTAVTEARAKVSSMQIDPSNMTEEQLKKFQEAQGELSQALGKLMMIKEAYPELKADKQFLNLQSQLEGTENRITVARKDFNDEAKTYNTSVRTFPTSIFAAIFGFEKRPYFEAEAGAEKAPTVEF